MIDMHAHCLPDVDDGAKTIQESLEMLHCAKKNGVSVVAATPHCITDKEEGVAEFLKNRNEAYMALADRISKNKEAYPDIVLGAEVYLGCDISEFSNLHDLCYENTDYLLVEMPSRYETNTLSEWIYNISVKGIVPVIAHVDRYTRYKEFIAEFSQVSDVVFQINANNFLTVSGRHLLKTLFKLHSNFVVSSDMHNCTTRPCNMPDAYRIAGKKFKENRDMLFEFCGEKILNNKKTVL